MAKELYIKEIDRLLSPFLVKPEAVMLMDTKDLKMGLGREQVIVFYPDRPKEVKKWADLDDDTLYAVYSFVEVHAKMHPTILEDVRELEPAEDKNWKIEPKPILAHDGQELGKIGVAVESNTEEKTECSVIYISPDGSWATLTMFRVDDESKSVAIEDLKDVGLAILNFANTI